MAAGQDGNQGAFDHDVLAENHRADGVLGRADVGGRRFRRAHDHIFELFEVFTACRRHGLSFLLSSVEAAWRLCNKRTRTDVPCADRSESASLFRQAYAILRRWGAKSQSCEQVRST